MHADDGLDGVMEVGIASNVPVLPAACLSAVCPSTVLRLGWRLFLDLSLKSHWLPRAIPFPPAKLSDRFTAATPGRSPSPHSCLLRVGIAER